MTETLKPPPKKLGVTHWSTRLLADTVGHQRVHLLPRRGATTASSPGPLESFRFSTDPELEAKVIDIVGLDLAPPENAIVLCVDEKSQIQALDRTMPVLPMQPGLARAQVA